MFFLFYNNLYVAGAWDMLRGKFEAKFEAVTGRSKSKDKQNKVYLIFHLVHICKLTVCPSPFCSFSEKK